MQKTKRMSLTGGTGNTEKYYFRGKARDKDKSKKISLTPVKSAPLVTPSISRGKPRLNTLRQVKYAML